MSGNLFNPPGPGGNLLPRDGETRYFGKVFGEEESGEFFRKLWVEIPWENDETFMFGKRHVTGRKVAWIAEGGIGYAYSGTRKKAHEWTETLLEVRGKVEKLTGASYNSCLLNLYHHGGEGMGWHSDDEKEIEPGSSIASVSFGAGRKFSMKHKETKQTISVFLEEGSLLEMKGETQRKWLHQMPKTKMVSEPRMNLTLRRVRSE